MESIYLKAIGSFREMVERRADRARSTDIFAELMELMRELEIEEQYVEEINSQVMPESDEEWN